MSPGIIFITVGPWVSWSISLEGGPWHYLLRKGNRRSEMLGEFFSSSMLRIRSACGWPAHTAMKHLEDRNYALCILCHTSMTSYQFDYLSKGCILVMTVCCWPLSKHFGKTAKELFSSIWELIFGLKSEL